MTVGKALRSFGKGGFSGPSAVQPKGVTTRNLPQTVKPKPPKHTKHSK